MTETNNWEPDLKHDLLIIVGVVVFAAVLFYGYILGELLLALIVTLLLIVIRVLYKILTAILHIEESLSIEQ
ncbi:hypothetical protein [Natronorubrum tibetense]|uniref:hypothetical protein n=1 Tax=Natronorubrum tibetense TaxID=63128 RepID=UPI0012688CA1|nr:hypothetical protein [Natronorubrum tibetense]